MTVNPTMALAQPIEVVIASGASLTDEINLGGRIPVGVIFPAAWTAANLTFQVSDISGGTYVDVYQLDGTEYEVTGSVSRYGAIDYTTFFGARMLKVRSGTTGTPVNQAADRTLKLMLGRPDV